MSTSVMPDHEDPCPELMEEPGTDSEFFPLSFSQQRLWFLNRLNPESASYHMPAAVRIRGPLRDDLLETCLTQIVRRHEALRTVFVTRGDTPYQVVQEAPLLSFAKEHVCGATQEETMRRVLEIVHAEIRRPFDLSVDPVIRFRLIKLNDNDHVFVITIHHIAADGWSIDILNAELSTLYAAHVAGITPSLPPLPIQYVDYTAWQRSQMEGSEARRQLEYWRGKLEHLPELALATDRPHPPVPSHQGGWKRIGITQGLTERLEQLAQAEHASLFMVLLAAFKVLLHRYTGQEDITVGSPIAGRTRAELELMIGFFVNSLVLRTRISGDDSMLDVLRKVRETTLDAYAAQDIPLDKLVEELRPERTLRKNPLFQHSFAVQHAMGVAESSRENTEDLSFEELPLNLDTARFDLEFNLRRTSDGMTLSVCYATDLFDAETIVEMMACYMTLLDSIVAAPASRISRLPMLPSGTAEQLVALGQGDQHPGEADLITHFERWVRETPDAVALWYGDKEMSYRDLDAASNRLAHCLKAHGVGPDILVGVCLERSFEMVIAILAIVKSGGAYTPFHPDDPLERLAILVRDTRTPVVITQERWAEKFSGLTKSLCLDRHHKEIAAYPATAPEAGIVPDNLAYVVYTSGSTGIPKGVAIAHRGIAKVVTDTDYVDFRNDDSFLQFAPLSFDASAFEIWSALLNGGRLVIAPPGASSLEDIGNLIRSQNVTISLLTSSLFHQLVDEVPERLRSLRYIFAGGEVVSPLHVRRAYAVLHGTQLLDSYGPTEVTVYACWYRIPRTFSAEAKSVPIGRPIPNRSVYVLDSSLNLVPRGVPGELCVSGMGVARGYLNAPQLTAERFVPDPFSTETGCRMYRTGDLVRYLPSGEIEFLGRIDDQVKIRGFRVELGEIEAVMRAHPHVDDAVVTVREDVPGVKQIVAYIVGDESPLPSWRAYAEEHLPEYMRPAAYVLMQALPLKPTGKVDRRALPEPIFGDEADYVAPRTELESLIVDLWQELLPVEQVGVLDNFFDLGGDSMMALKAVSRLGRRGITVTIKQLYKHQTIADLATAIETEAVDDASDAREADKPTAVE